MLLVLQLEVVPHRKDRTRACCASLCFAVLWFSCFTTFGTEAMTLLFSVKSTFTTKRLKPPPDIQLFTSDKAPSSAPTAGGATVTFYMSSMSYENQSIHRLPPSADNKAALLFPSLITPSKSPSWFFFTLQPSILIWCSYFCYTARTISAEILNRCFLQYKQCRQNFPQLDHIY